jgi:hypothetical protein
MTTTPTPDQGATSLPREPSEDVLRGMALAMLTDIGNGDQFDLDDPFRRITTIQLSSADFIGMAEAAYLALVKHLEDNQT